MSRRAAEAHCAGASRSSSRTRRARSIPARRSSTACASRSSCRVRRRLRRGGARRRPAAARRSQRQLPRPLPARAVGRPEAAGQHRPRARAGARSAGVRRSRLRARRLGAGRGAQHARRPAHELGLSMLFIGHDLAVVCPRRRPHRRDVPRQPDGAGADGRRARGAAAPVHGGAALGGTGGAPAVGPHAGARRADRRDPEPDAPALGVRVPSALPARPGHLRIGRPGVAGRRRRSLGRLPLRRDARPASRWPPGARGDRQVRPSSARSSAVCSPSSGAGRDGPTTARRERHGGPASRRRPTSG